MVGQTYLLTDEQMRHFIVNGYVTVKIVLPASFHEAIFTQTQTVFEKEGNPGNNLLPRIPEIQAVFADQWVSGALISVLGADYYMQPHRHYDEGSYSENLWTPQPRWIGLFATLDLLRKKSRTSSGFRLL